MSGMDMNRQRSSENINVSGDPSMFNHQQDFYQNFYNPGGQQQHDHQAQSQQQQSFNPSSGSNAQNSFSQEQQQSDLLGTSFDVRLNSQAQGFQDFPLYA